MSTASSSVLSSPIDLQSRPAASPTQRSAEARAAFVASLNSVGASLDNELQGRAKDIHDNQKALDKQEKGVEEETAKLKKQGDEIEGMVEKAKKDFGEIDTDELGDLMGDFDRELAALEETLDMVEGGGVEAWGPEEREDVVMEGAGEGERRSDK